MAQRAYITVPVWNQWKFTEIFLDSLTKDSHRPDYSICIVDNGSSDGTQENLGHWVEKIKREFPKDSLHIIRNEKNLGVAPAWNQGVRWFFENSESDPNAYLAILNNDLCFPSGWINPLLQKLKQPRLGFISPFSAERKLDYNLQKRAESFTRKNSNAFWNDYSFCAVIFNKWCLAELGLFDENFLVGGYEDTDYAFRANKAKIQFGVTGASFIHHFGSQTLGEFKATGDKHVPGSLKYFREKWSAEPRPKPKNLLHKLRLKIRKLALHLDYML